MGVLSRRNQWSLAMNKQRWEFGGFARSQWVYTEDTTAGITAYTYNRVWDQAARFAELLAQHVDTQSHASLSTVNWERRVKEELDKCHVPTIKLGTLDLNEGAREQWHQDATSTINSLLDRVAKLEENP